MDIESGTAGSRLDIRVPVEDDQVVEALRLGVRGMVLKELARELTPREVELVRLAASGLRNREMSRRLAISEGTVKMHLHNVYRKLQLQNRVELANYARQKGLV
jgi:DNA-binding NarL/FixJ family response regulator